MTTFRSRVYEGDGEPDILELQRDLNRKYTNVGSKVEKIWRNFTPKQRETAMREAVGDGKVLKNSRDPGLGRLNEILPDWNLEEITSTPEFFLNRLEYRAKADMRYQLVQGLSPYKGDREIVRAAAQRLPPDPGNYMMFGDLDKVKYGQPIGPRVNTAAGRRAFEETAAKSPLTMIPANEARAVMHRQRSTLIYYNALVEEILDLGSESRVSAAPSKTTTKQTSNAMAKLTIAPKPLKASIAEIIAQADGQRTASEDYLELLRSEPAVLNHAVNATNFSRPELVPDERGRILPLMADKYLSIAFFEVMSNAIKTIVTWDYISRLIRMLDGLDDKVKRPLIMQELSNTCHLEYRRAQSAFRRQMSSPVGVASKSFRRITAGGSSKVAVKGQPPVPNSHLHYILRLCQPDTSHTEAAQLIHKLDEYHTRHVDEFERLSGDQVFALGDLAIILSFMHTLSSSLAMTPTSKKTGLLFTGRTAELDAELEQYKATADFGEFLIPDGNLLEQGASASALRALGDYVIENAGTSLGLLYEELLSECLNDIEEKYSDVRIKLEKADKTAYVPLPAEEPKSASFRADQRREKAKTRPAEAGVYQITAIAPRQPDITAMPAPRLKVKASVAAVFTAMFTKSEARGSVAWADFAAAMADMGFTVTPKGGSIFTFNPPKSMGVSSITLHRPHASEIEGYKLLIISRRLNRKFGWDADTFEVE